MHSIKITIVSIIVMGFYFFHSISGCPTCVAMVEEYTPPFFAQEFYTPQEGAQQDGQQHHQQISNRKSSPRRIYPDLAHELEDEGQV